MVQLSEGASTGMRSLVFSRLLVAVDDSEEGRRAVDFAGAWCRAVGADRRIVEWDTARRRTRNRSWVSATVDAARDFGADVIVVGCENRWLARHRLRPSLRARLMQATDLPLLVLTPQRRRGQENGEDVAGHLELDEVSPNPLVHV